MADLAEIKRVAKTTTNDRGEPVVEIPLSIWEQFVTQTEYTPSQKAQIEMLLEQWAKEPEEDMPDGWWEEFMAFLNANHLHFKDRDLGLSDE